jgi:hypothetical protein
MEILSKSEIELLRKEAREEGRRLLRSYAKIEAQEKAAKDRPDRPAPAEKPAI